ncbi:homeobox protein 2-like [Culicoides brevitarsis]|uniref:homeobox protein 2-like n=1 Tax=Culicoides brevitarsis TaxID=469753 RepID=UPI00307B10CD
MALNIAVPLSGVSDMLGENFNLISPMSLQSSANASPNFDCRTTTKVLCSPIDSESSGISSLDSEEIKKSSASSTPTDDEHGADPPSMITSDLTSEQKTHLLSPKPKHATTTEKTIETSTTIATTTTKTTDDEQETKNKTEETNQNEKRSNDVDIAAEEIPEAPIAKPQVSPNYESLSITANARNILDLGANLMGHVGNNGNIVWQHQGFMRYAVLPTNNNLRFFLENRSQYHRLGANGHLQEFNLVDCKCCDFTYPINENHAAPSGSACSNILKSVSEMCFGGNVVAPPQPPTCHQPQIQRPSAQNGMYAANQNASKYNHDAPNFDHFMFNNNLNAALNRSNYQSNNILENIAVALLNTTNSAGMNMNGNGGNNGHHYNQQYGGNNHYGTKNYNTSHSSYNNHNFNNSYKQFKAKQEHIDHFRG